MNNNDAPQMAPTLEHATHALGLWIERTFGAVGLTQAEAHVLAYVARHPRAAINDLHTSFGHKRSTLTSILDRLEARGWVTRGAHPTSRRLVAVELTETGRTLGERVSDALHAVEERVRARMGEAAIADAVALLHTLEEELR
jgi:DNA-binding MarR family transcriptional regulator